MKSRAKAWLFLGLALVIFIGLVLILTPHTPKVYPDYVSSSPSPTGTEALYTALSKQTQVGVWKKQAGQLSGKNQFMMLAAPYQNFDRQETKQWINWMKKGNQVLLAVDDPTGYFQLKFKEVNPGSKPSNIIKGFGRTFQSSTNSFYRLLPREGDRILLKDRLGVLALSHPYGKGHLLVFIDPEWITNAHILKKDHLTMLMDLMNQSPANIIWINERIHGSQSLPAYLSVYPKWMVILLFQGLIGFLLWLWYKGKRFGPVQDPREASIRIGDERLFATSAWYLRGGFYKEALTIQMDYFRDVLYEKWGLSRDASLENLLSSCQRRLGEEKARSWSMELKYIQERLGQRQLSNKDFIEVTKQIDEMRNEVEDA